MNLKIVVLETHFFLIITLLVNEIEFKKNEDNFYTFQVVDIGLSMHWFPQNHIALEGIYTYRYVFLRTYSYHKANLILEKTYR